MTPAEADGLRNLSVDATGDKRRQFSGASRHKLTLINGPILRDWRTLNGSIHGDTLAWPRDSAYVYASDLSDPDPRIFRIHLSDGERTAVDLAALKALSGHVFPGFGLAPDGSPILLSSTIQVRKG